MSAIKDKNRQPALDIKFTAWRHAASVIFEWHRFSLILFSVTVICFLCLQGPATASDFMVPVKSIAQITVDDNNNKIEYPAAVFFDPVMEEIYVVNGGKGQVVVYGPDFFPRLSIGTGRGVITPRGGAVMDNGEIYICQVKTAKNPRPRVTILNGAFFVDWEIYLDEIPEIEDFRPRNLAINSDGIIYLAGDNYRGVLVLDNEGNFLRLLQPTDDIILRGEEAAVPPESQEGPEMEGEEGPRPEEEMYADIPEEYRPRSSLPASSSGLQEVVGPVKVNYVTMDSTGKIYLISAETGKIYVYGPDESFLFSFGTKGGSPGQQSNPRALAIDEEIGVIYVVDYMRHTILAYNMDGEYIFEFGGRGFNPGWFNFPNDIAMNNQGQVIIADLFNRRIQVLEIGKEGISYYLNKSSLEPADETSDAVELPGPDEISPEQPESIIDLPADPDASLEQLYETIKEEKSNEEGEMVLEEEVIEEPQPVLPDSPSKFDEPLVTPE